MKKAKRFLSALLMSMIMVVMATACITANAASAWSVNFAVDGASHTVTSSDVSKLASYTVTAGYIKGGVTYSHSYTGARLKDVLKSIGVSDVKTVSATGTDGYVMKAPYDESLAMDDNTLLAWKMDGTDMSSSNGPVMLIPGGNSTTGSQFVKMVGTVNVTGATLIKNSSSPSSSSSSADVSSSASASSSVSNPSTGNFPSAAADIVVVAAAAIVAVAVLRKARK